MLSSEGSTGGGPGRRRIPAVIHDAAVEARRLAAEASASAEAILLRAQAEAEGVRVAARAEGRAQGLALTAELAARAARLRDGALETAEAELVDLAFEIARRVLGSLAERDRSVVVEVAARALERARSRAEVTLRAHPADAAALREAEPALLAALSRCRRIAVREDVSVERGGVVVETEIGAIDARLGEQVAALRRALDEGAP
jgi:flagellar assembly protein FliH